MPFDFIRRISFTFGSPMNWFLIATSFFLFASANSANAKCLLAQGDVSTPYFGAECGTYALAAAARVAGVDTDKLAIINGDYVRQRSGSSEADLVRAAHDHGFSATPMRAISENYLRRSSWPIVLNLNYEAASPNPGHWIAFLGDDQGRAKIFDVANKERVSSIPYSDLLAKMTGEGILVSPVRLGPLERVIDRIEGLTHLWPLAVLVFFPLHFKKVRSNGPLFQIAVLFGFTIVWAGTIYFVSPSSFLKNRGAVAWIQAKYFAEDSIPNVSPGQFEAYLLRDDVLVIDSRTPMQFEYSHVPGSFNLCVDLRPEEFIKSTRFIDKSKTLVVYCNNFRCAWSTTVATRLKGAGFVDVRVFEAGLEEYLKQRGQKTRVTD